MRPKGRTQYVGNTAQPRAIPTKKRKGSKSQYRIPKAAQQTRKDQQYLEFQATPRLNEVTANLRIRQKCDTILGGRRIWLRGETNTTPPEQYRFPIIVDGTRCDNDSTKVHRVDGKNHKRCRDHTLTEYWIPQETPSP